MKVIMALGVNLKVGCGVLEDLWCEIENITSNTECEVGTFEWVWGLGPMGDKNKNFAVLQ
jgi:hypothetical protein